MSYNNQPEWETYKPTIKEEDEICGEYDCGCSSSVPYSYIMWGRNEDGEEEEVEICRRCANLGDWEEKGWVYSNDYKDYEEYLIKKKEKLKKKKLKIVIKKKPKLVIKKKPTFKEEFNKWNDFNNEWLFKYNMNKLVEMYNGKNIPEMEEITKKICKDINEKQIESNKLKTNTWCKILLTMEAEEQDKTSLSLYKIVKDYHNKVSRIKKDIQKAVDINMADWE